MSTSAGIPSSPKHQHFHCRWKPECDIYLTDLQFGIPAAINGPGTGSWKAIAPKNSDMFNEKIIFQPMEALGGTYFVRAGPATGRYFPGLQWDYGQ